jgi:hypothetical protein
MMLEPPTPATVYVFPPLVFLLFLGLGLLLHKTVKNGE